MQTNIHAEKYFLNILKLNQIWIVRNEKSGITIQNWFNLKRYKKNNLCLCILIEYQL